MFHIETLTGPRHNAGCQSFHINNFYNNSRIPKKDIYRDSFMSKYTVVIVTDNRVTL